MKDKPWQDIISEAGWDTLIDKYKKGQMKSLATTKGDKFRRFFRKSYSIPPGIVSLSQQIKYYHGLEKPSIATLAKRAGMLRMIAATGQMFLQTYKVKSMQVVKSQFFNVDPKDDDKVELAKAEWKAYKSIQFDYAIAKLIRRSLRKADYIDKLKQHVDNAEKGFTGKSSLLEYLKSQTKPSDDESLLSMHSDVLLEKIDPWHRHYEGKVSLHSNPNAAFPIVFGVQRGGSVYGAAFMNWIRDAHYPDLPFFVWLEGHYACTSLEDKSYQALLNSQGDLDYVIPKGSVGYQNAKAAAAQSAIRFLSASNGSVWSYKLDGEDLDVKLYDTQSVLSEGGEGPQGIRMKGWHAEAFVWSRDGIIYTAEHRGGQFHHSSFLSGKKVRCSGMIEAKGGKIIRVSNDSGHYKPQTRHLKAFVQFLIMQNAFGTDAKVVDKSKEAKGVTPQAFLQAGGGQGAVRSEVERIMQVRRDFEKMNSKRTTLRQLVEIRYQELRTKVGNQWPEYSLWKRAYKQVCLDFATIDSSWKRRANAPPIPRTRAVRH